MNNKLDGKIVGQLINSVLAKKRVLQKDLAAGIGVKPNVISYYCKGTRLPNISQLVEIADYLDVTVDYLLGRSSDPSRDVERASVCDYTGLSPETVSFLHEKKDDHIAGIIMLDSLITDRSLVSALTNYAWSFIPAARKESEYRYIPVREERFSNLEDVSFARVIKNLSSFGDSFKEKMREDKTKLDLVLYDYCLRHLDVTECKRYLDYIDYLSSEDDSPTDDELLDYDEVLDEVDWEAEQEAQNEEQEQFNLEERELEKWIIQAYSDYQKRREEKKHGQRKADDD